MLTTSAVSLRSGAPATSSHPFAGDLLLYVLCVVFQRVGVAGPRVQLHEVGFDPGNIVPLYQLTEFRSQAGDLGGECPRVSAICSCLIPGYRADICQRRQRIGYEDAFALMGPHQALSP